MGAHPWPRRGTDAAAGVDLRMRGWGASRLRVRCAASRFASPPLPEGKSTDGGRTNWARGDCNRSLLRSPRFPSSFARVPLGALGHLLAVSRPSTPAPGPARIVERAPIRRPTDCSTARGRPRSTRPSAAWQGTGPPGRGAGQTAWRVGGGRESGERANEPHLSRADSRSPARIPGCGWRVPGCRIAV
jgi:hypothetical protein